MESRYRPIRLHSPETEPTPGEILKAFLIAGIGIGLFVLVGALALGAWPINLLTLGALALLLTAGSYWYTYCYRKPNSMGGYDGWYDNLFCAPVLIVHGIIGVTIIIFSSIWRLVADLARD